MDWSCRWTYADFFKRYKVLAVSADVQRQNMRQTCENVISKLVPVSGVFYFFFNLQLIVKQNKLWNDHGRRSWTGGMSLK